MRETTEIEVRLEHGKPASCSGASRAPGHFGCLRAGWDRISLWPRLGETQNQPQGTGNPENVGLDGRAPSESEKPNRRASALAAIDAVAAGSIRRCNGHGLGL